MPGKIVPKKLAKGVDFCGVSSYYYIIRSDLGCYMKASNITQEVELEVFSLHPSCRGGDHYLAHKNGSFYIIKGNSYRCVQNMNTDEASAVFTLHPNCQGGDHYLSAFDYYYIIFQSRGIYRRTTNMNLDEEGEDFPLQPNCRNGLYYFGLDDYYYFVKPHDQLGVQYVRSKNFNLDENSETFSFHPSVVIFLPGGISVIEGPSYGEWKHIKTISNDSQTPIQWQKKITRKVGYNREEMSSIEQNLKVTATISAETGGLLALILKAQFSLTPEYGGFNVNTEKENWSNATEIEETISAVIQPLKKIYIWQYELGLGKKPVLFLRNIKIWDTPNPPTDVPLPRLQISY